MTMDIDATHPPKILPTLIRGCVSSNEKHRGSNFVSDFLVEIN